MRKDEESWMEKCWEMQINQFKNAIKRNSMCTYANLTSSKLVQMKNEIFFFKEKKGRKWTLNKIERLEEKKTIE